MKQYQYLFFDLDGTLTDPKEGITKSVQHALRHFGIEEPDLDKLTLFIGPPLGPSFREFYGLSEEQAQEAIWVFRERFSTVGLYENRVLEGIPEMLAQLKAQGKHLSVASSKPEVFVRKILERFELLPYFDEVVGASFDEKMCEKADIIREAIRRIGLQESDYPRILMIGDRKHDVEGAKQCGLSSLGVYTGFAPEGELEAAGADYIAGNIHEMEQMLTGTGDS